MQIEKIKISEIGDKIIYGLAAAKDHDAKVEIYNDFENSLIAYSPAVTSDEIQHIIKHNFYNFDLLAGYDEPKDITEFLQCLAYENDSYCLYETVAQLIYLCNGKNKNLKI